MICKYCKINNDERPADDCENCLHWREYCILLEKDLIETLFPDIKYISLSETIDLLGKRRFNVG